MQRWQTSFLPLTMAGMLLVMGCHADQGGANYRVGVATAVITPTEPMWAGGYAARNKPIADTEHDLYAKALVLEDHQGQRLVVVTTDLVGLPRSIAEPVAAAIGERFDLERRQIMLTSSHTHSGPALRESLVDIYPMDAQEWEKVDRYSAWLEGRLVDVVGDAIKNLAPATLAHGIGRATFAVNRRKPTPKGIINDANPAGPVDHDVPVLRVHGEDGSLRAVLFGYACHCTTLGYYKWCGDYAGFAQINLEASHPGATSMFFAGCGADANPLPRRKLELCVKYGRALSEAVDRVLAGKMEPVAGPLTAACRIIELPFDKLPDRAELERQRQHGNRWEKSRAKRLLARIDAGKPLSPTYPYPIQVFQLGRELTLVALAGEVVVDYSHRLKRELGANRTWVAAYANDVFAYIPSRRVLAEGGYEGDTSMAVYGLPTKWAPAIEEMIVSTVHELTNQVRPVTRP